MYVEGWILFAIYFIAVLALSVSVYALWSLEEIRLYYKRLYSKQTKVYNLPQQVSKTKKSHWSN